jgi:hypothetical protein
MGNKRKKLYVYVDESGQDTAGLFFIVAIVIAGEERERLVQELEKIERESLKRTMKWKKVDRARRIAYLEKVSSSPLFAGKISYAIFSGRRDYREMTVIATAGAITSAAPVEGYEATVCIDGLDRIGSLVVSAELRHRYIKLKKVRGLRDESSALIRLADAVAGFVRDCMEGNRDLQQLYQRMVARNFIRKL